MKGHINQLMCQNLLGFALDGGHPACSLHAARYG
jgi:hypothetical protein